jgi:hypothetical protein
MSKALRAKVREISQEALRRMEADASIAMLELSASFRKHVNRDLRDMAILMATPRPDDADWRRRLHELSRDLQGVGGSFDYGLLITIAEVMSRTIKNDALPSERKLQRRLTAYQMALNAIISFDLQGDGGHDGHALLSALRITSPAAPVA